MEKRIALLKDGIVFNIIVGPSAEEMAILFGCDAIEVTPETGQATVGYGFSNGVFDSPPPPPEIVEEPNPSHPMNTGENESSPEEDSN